MTDTSLDGGLLFVDPIDGARAGRTVPIRLALSDDELLGGEATVRVGRLPLNDVVLAHPAVSRRHAEVWVRLEKGAVIPTAEVIDLGSTVGTFVRRRPPGADAAPGRGADAWRRLAPHQPTPLGGTPCQVGPFFLSYQPAYPDVAGWSPEDDPVSQEGALAPHPLPERRAVDPAPAARASTEAPAPSRDAPSRYLRDLPAIFHDTSPDDGGPGFLGRMLLIYEGLWEPLEQRQDHIAAYFDPRTCPAEMLPWLAGWFGLPLRPHWDEGRRRRLLADAFELLRWRGTRYALVRMIELCTDVTPVIVDDERRRAIIRVRLPHGRGDRHEADAVRREVEAIVRANKPAHVGYVFEEV